MKRTFILILTCLTLLALVLSAPGPVSAAHGAGPLEAQKASPKELLNADGTLNLNGTFHGALDLNGWNVQMDPQRGPVFAPDAEPAPGQWASVGAGANGAFYTGIYAVAVSGTDVYVGGNFTDANDPAADYIAKWDGISWSALGSNGAGDGSLNLGVRVIVISGMDVYVGGVFTDVNNNGTVLPAADYIAKWNGTSWSALGSNGAGNGSLNASVHTIAVSEMNIYAGGEFTDVNNTGTVLTSADYVAKWNALTSNWSALGSNGAANGSLNGYVHAIAASGSNVYVGGEFKNVNNNGMVLKAADYVVKWNGTSWSALGSNGAGNGSITDTVYAIAISGANVYVGGDFNDVNNQGTILPAADYIAKWNALTGNWSALGSNGAGGGALNWTVYAIAISETNVYVGGAFVNVNSMPAADYIAKWNGTSWSALGSTGAGNGSLNKRVEAIAVIGSNVYIGGWFQNVKNKNGTSVTTADHFAKWNALTGNWSALGSNGVDGSISFYVVALAVSGTDVYVGGDFTDVNNHGVAVSAADYIAKWDGTRWSALGSNGAGNGSLRAPVNTIKVSGTNVYVGGEFTNVNNNGTVLPAADYIAKWDTMTGNWSALGSNGAGNGSLNHSVNAIAVSGKNVYVGGHFVDVNNNGTALTAADYIAKWNTLTGNWSSLGSNGAGDGSLNWDVFAIAMSGTNVYVGGGFTNVNNNGTILTAADYIAKWNGTSWSSLGSNGAGNGSLDAKVLAIAASGMDVYVGGWFTDVNNNGMVLPQADVIAKWNGTNWSALGSNGAGDGAIQSEIKSIAVHGTNVYVGGWFTDVNNNGTVLTKADNIAKWNGTNWSALGSNGAGNGAIKIYLSYVNAIAISGKNLYVGGTFKDVNNNGMVLPAADYIAAYGLGAVPTATPTRTRTMTFTPTSTATSTPTPSLTSTVTETPSATITVTETMTATPTPTPTSTPTETETPSATETTTETPTLTP